MEENPETGKGDLEQTQNRHHETALRSTKKYFPNADEKSAGDKHKVTAAVLASS